MTGSHTLDDLTCGADKLKAVRKSELNPGDVLIVRTVNTTYTIRVVEEHAFLVSGGWFDNNRLSPMKTTIVGCTWGGSAVKHDLVAACGLCLEFGNQIVTTPIQSICVVPSCVEN